MPPLAPPRMQPSACSQPSVVTNCRETTYDLVQGSTWGAEADLRARRADPWEARSIARSANLPRVSLDCIPDEVDVVWWARHAHLLRDLDDSGRLFLEPGSARRVAEPTVTPERISGTSGDWSRAFTRRVRRLRNLEKCQRACAGLDPHVVITGPQGMDPAVLALLVADAARRPLGLGAAQRSADWTTASSLLAGLPQGGVLFLERPSLGRGSQDDVPGDDARELSIPLRAALIEGVAQGALTREVSDGVTQRDITLWLPWFVIVVVSSDEAQGFDPSVGPDHAEPVHAERLGSTAERLAGELFEARAFTTQPIGAQQCGAQPCGAQPCGAGPRVRVRPGAPNVRRSAVG